MKYFVCGFIIILWMIGTLLGIATLFCIPVMLEMDWFDIPKQVMDKYLE